MSNFDSNGNYNKTEWKDDDLITADKLNKIEDAIQTVNKNDIERHKEADGRLDALEEQNEVIEEELNNKATKDEVHERLDVVEGELEDLLKNGLVLPSGKDDTQTIQNMLDTNQKVTLTKGVYNISSLTIPSGGQIIGTSNTTINANGTKVFYFPKDIGNLSLKNFTIQTSNSEYCFYFDGELGSVITDGVIEDVKIVGFITPVYAKYLRKFNFNRISSHCKNFMEYTGKSAEVNINNSYLVHYSEINEDSFGIKSYAEGEYYPEGLMINNTLIYHFEQNFNIEDLMVANFTNIHSDSGGEHCLPNKINYNKLTQTIKFDTCWFYSTKFIIGGDKATNANSYRMEMTNCSFENCKDGIAIAINKFSSNITISGCRFSRSYNSTNCIGIVCAGSNNHININNIDFFGFISYAQFKEEGLYNTISNIPNNDKLEAPFHLEYSVNTNDIFIKNKSYYISPGMNISSGTTIINETLKLSEGTYVCKVRMNQLNITSPGFLQLVVEGDNIYSSKGEEWSSSLLYLRYQEFETSFYFNVSYPSEANLLFKSVDAVFTVGYHSYIEIIKL